MKRLSYSFLCLTMAFGLITCSQKSSGDEQADADEWKEMEAFHTVMADVFHPLKDSGNLEPIRSRAEELATFAAQWADAELPEKVDNEDVQQRLLMLKMGTRELADEVKAQAADSVVNSHLTDLHDQFHALQEAWHHEGEPHKH